MEKKVIIIGAGIAGLSAGCYARMNGYQAEIHETHNLPGGLCTAWNRKGYTIDGCIHWLTGSSPGSGLYRIWEELGAVQGRPMYDHDVFCSFVGRDGRKLTVYTYIDRLETHLNELSPKDAAVSSELCGLIRRLAKFSWAPAKTPELMNWLDGLKMMAGMGRYLKDFIKIGDQTMGQFGTRFTDPLVRTAISNMFYDRTMPLMALVMTLGPMSKRQAGFPLGGSLEFARAFERRFLGLGGKIVYQSRVEKIIEREGRAIGVRLANGEEITGNYVISAADLRTSLYSLLDGTRVDPVHLELITSGKLYPSAAQVTFGVDMNFSREISCIGTAYELEVPISIAGQEQSYIAVKNYCFDPSLAPPGKSVVGSFIMTGDWAYWDRLGKDRPAYLAEKERIAAVCRDEFNRLYPGFASKIEMTDVATPLTFERYTGNWKGTFMTWILSNEFRRKHPFIPKTVPGLSGFYLASMWTNPPGGIPGAADVGRDVVQLLCNEDRKRFVTSLP